MSVARVLVALLCAACPPALAAAPPGLATSVIGGSVDPNGKVPVFDGVPGSGILNFDVPGPQSLFSHGAVYTVCVSWQNNGFTGAVDVKYVIFRKVGTTNKVIQSDVLKTGFQINGGNGIYAFCTNSKPLPNSPGTAVLQGLVTYHTSPKVFMSSVTSGIYLQ